MANELSKDILSSTTMPVRPRSLYTTHSYHGSIDDNYQRYGEFSKLFDSPPAEQWPSLLPSQTAPPFNSSAVSTVWQHQSRIIPKTMQPPYLTGEESYNYLENWREHAQQSGTGAAIVTPHATLSLRMHERVRVDMTIDRAVRIINPKSNIVLALSGSGSTTALIHPNGRIYQYGSRVEIMAHDAHGNNKYAKMWYKGISFTSEQCALVYLVDAAGTRTTTDNFADLSQDFSWSVFYNDSCHGTSYLQEAISILQAAQYWVTEDGVEQWIINNIRISQTPDGLVRAKQRRAMEKHLLQKEEEYYKVNNELELKTQHLMKEVENVMNLKPLLQKRASTPSEVQGRCSSASTSNYRPNYSGHGFSLCARATTPRNVSAENLRERTAELLEDNVGKTFDKNIHIKYSLGRINALSEQELPHIEGVSKKVDQLISGLHMSTFGDKDSDDEALYHGSVDKKICILRNKIKRLQSDMQALQTDHKKKTEEWKKLQTELKLSQEQCAKLQQKNMMLTETLKKQEQQNADLTSSLSQKEEENKASHKELQMLRKELKAAMKTVAATQVQLNHALEEKEKLQATVKHYKSEDKELRECNRKKVEEFAQTMHKTEKGKAELLHICKVQMQLIDNLKKQKVHLQAARMVQFTEEEFLKLMDWNPSSFSQ